MLYAFFFTVHTLVRVLNFIKKSMKISYIQLYKSANEILDKNKVKVLPSYDDPKVLANEFNEYFV